MKAVHCSWVDMQKIRQSLCGRKRGDQKQLEQMRCVQKGTVSGWQAACDIIEAVDGKVRLVELSEFQPTHAQVLARAMRKKYGGDSSKWPSEATEEIEEWIDRCESEKLTKDQLRELLKPKESIRHDIEADFRKIKKLIDSLCDKWETDADRAAARQFFRQQANEV